MSQRLSLHSPQYPPKFSIDQEVVWAYVESHDYGSIIGYAWVNQTICKASGYHYLIKLATSSVSYSFCKQDWAFEKDIEALEEFNNRSIGGVAWVKKKLRLSRTGCGEECILKTSRLCGDHWDTNFWEYCVVCLNLPSSTGFLTPDHRLIESRELGISEC